jgi:small subunit ribosomal protein S17
MAEDIEDITPDTPTENGVETEAATAAPDAQSDSLAETEAATAQPQAPAPEMQSDSAAKTAGAQAASEPQEQLSSKERRRRARSTHSGAAHPQRTTEQRKSERAEQRAVKASRRRTRRAQERAKAAERRASAPASEPLAPVHAQVEGAPKSRLGRVVSDKAAKTITVRIDVARRHRRYEKIVRSSTTLHAHDENNEAHVGDLVRVVESRPLSRTKRWRLVDVLERAR